MTQRIVVDSEPTDSNDASAGDGATSILLVDDEPSVRLIIGDLLRARGYRVLTAECGEGALQLATEHAFDLAIVDYKLPGIDGVQTMQALREIHPLSPRILLTANLDLPTAVEAVNLGEISRALQKPVSATALYQCVSEALEIQERLLKAKATQAFRRQADERKAIVECLTGSYLQLALQPVVSSKTHVVVGREALLRSNHPHFLGPLSVLRAVENHQMVQQLGELVADRALGWLERMPEQERLFINLHPEELSDTEALTARLERLQPFASRMALEITERKSLENIHCWEDSVQAIVDRGFAIAVDDLGAGYNSLSVLAGLQPRYMKTDMSIVRDIDTHPRKQRLVELLSRFAEATDALLIAEGIETAREAETLRACGAHFLQGYHFGRPELDPAL